MGVSWAIRGKLLPTGPGEQPLLSPGVRSQTSVNLLRCFPRVSTVSRARASGTRDQVIPRGPGGSLWGRGRGLGGSSEDIGKDWASRARNPFQFLPR